MPNIVTHMVIGAHQNGESAEFILGNALPDFAGMIADYKGQRIIARQTYSPSESPDLDYGVTNHYRIDSIYDASALKTNLRAKAMEDFHAFTPELSRGAMLACADAGLEILFDSVMLQDNHNRHIFGAIRTLIDQLDVEALLTRDMSSGIRDYFENDDIPDSYGDPQWVARSLQRRLEVRRGQRLMFNKSSIDGVAYVLGKQMIRLENSRDGISKLLLQSTVTSAI